MRKDEFIYQQMLKAIVEHHLLPDVRLPEDQLAEAFQVSRTGIRKVLHRLALERFVTITPNKGAHVAKPTAEEAEQVLDSRILIEPVLIDGVVAHWSESSKTRLYDIVKQEKVAEQNNNLKDMIQLSASFHTELATLSGNLVMAEFVNQLTLRSSLVIAVFGSKQSVGCDCGHHHDLVDMLDRGEAESAKVWMKRHLEAIKASLQFTIDKPKSINFKDLFSTI
ncbi:putative HTH-type transcriptional regulator YdfH [Marinomonas spartinae]|uniref:Putative HTH-type transcriptional regulator YdfH n=1 Tax=Marinomonas spartinae TaxID=1792290 RepID=A0A1A8TEF9_9GAMM|nr:GntR family transcriptional regulator [Marinomonas spartinae]SBS30216.1 putative HTH-type transcriptional regulator YdfH [Marinomonas spartinae]